MIGRLQKKFIWICIVSFLVVFTVIFGTIYVFTYYQATSSSDHLADIIMENHETFPPFDANYRFPNNSVFIPNNIGPESPFTTRFFIVRFGKDGRFLSADLSAIASVSVLNALEYGHAALEQDHERGWINEYRYKAVSSPMGTSIVFINNSNFKITSGILATVAAIILLVGGSVFIAVVIIFSRRAVRPVAESYEKQKRFITDVNHELKTPLTLMLTNVDILESEMGKNEWLEDIRFEGNKMTELINRLVYLARMDEETVRPTKSVFNLSEMVNEMVALFQPLASHQNLTLTCAVEAEVYCFGDKAEIRQLICALTENALKYCDAGGCITITLKGGKHPTFWVDNHYAAVGTLRFDLLFDRFYRADSARVSGEGSGIGLSIAKAIAEKHHAEIWAQNINDTVIRFGVTLKKPPAFTRAGSSDI